MPCFKLLTNLPKAKIPVDFVNKIIPILAKTVNKAPERFVCVVTPDCSVTFGGDSTSPGAVATLESIGNLGISENKIITKEVTAFVEKELGIVPDSIVTTVCLIVTLVQFKTGYNYREAKTNVFSVVAPVILAYVYHDRSSLYEYLDIQKLTPKRERPIIFITFYDMKNYNVARGGITIDVIEP